MNMPKLKKKKKQKMMIYHFKKYVANKDNYK